MSISTSKRMELLQMKPDAYLSARVSKPYKALVNEVAQKQSMDESKFVRWAVESKIEDLESKK